MSSSAFTTPRDRERAADAKAAINAGKLPMPPSLAPGKAFNHGMGEAAEPSWIDSIAKPRNPNTTDAEREHRKQVIRDVDALFASTDFAVLCATPFKGELSTTGYDANCGMESREAFERRLLKACFIDDLRKAYQAPADPHQPRLYQRAPYHHAIIWGLAQKRADGYWNQPVTPAVLPQALQSKEDATPAPQTRVERIIEPVSAEREDMLDKAAEAKWKVAPAKINELFEAVQYAIAHPHKSEALALPDGFTLLKNGHTWKLHHPAIDRVPVVATRLDDTSDFRDVARRSDIRECLVALRENVAEKKAKRGGMTTIGAAVKVVMEHQVAAAKFNTKAQAAGKTLLAKTGVAVTGPYSHGFVDQAGKVWGL